MVEYYNEITSENGSSVIINDWNTAGIYDTIKTGSSGLQPIDPFEDISPLVTEYDESESFDIITDNELIDNPDSYNLLFYQTYDTYIPVVFVSVFCYFVFQVRRFGTFLVLHF